MGITYGSHDLVKRIIDGHNVEKVMYDGNQIWPNITPPGPQPGPVQEILSYDFLNSSRADVRNNWYISAGNIYLDSNGLSSSNNNYIQRGIDLAQASYLKGEVIFYTTAIYAHGRPSVGLFFSKDGYDEDFGLELLSSETIYLRLSRSRTEHGGRITFPGIYKLVFEINLCPYVDDMHSVTGLYDGRGMIYDGATEVIKNAGFYDGGINNIREFNKLNILTSADNYIQNVSLKVGRVPIGNYITINSCDTSIGQYGGFATFNITASSPIGNSGEGDVSDWFTDGNNYVIELFYQGATVGTTMQQSFISLYDGAITANYTVNF